MDNTLAAYRTGSTTRPPNWARAARRETSTTAGFNTRAGYLAGEKEVQKHMSGPHLTSALLTPPPRRLQLLRHIPDSTQPTDHQPQRFRLLRYKHPSPTPHPWPRPLKETAPPIAAVAAAERKYLVAPVVASLPLRLGRFSRGGVSPRERRTGRGLWGAEGQRVTRPEQGAVGYRCGRGSSCSRCVGWPGSQLPAVPYRPAGRRRTASRQDVVHAASPTQRLAG